MTGDNRNVWYLGVVLAAFVVVQAGTGFQLLAATGLPLGTVAVAVYDLCEETCGPEQNCEEPCYPEPETGLITCGEYEDGWESGWCAEPYCSQACGNDICEPECHEDYSEMGGIFCCEEDCTVCGDGAECDEHSDCESGEVCFVGDCKPVTDPEPGEPPNDMCGPTCEGDDCCGFDVCVDGWCTYPWGICEDAPECFNDAHCNGSGGPGACANTSGVCYCHPHLLICAFIASDECVPDTGPLSCDAPEAAEAMSATSSRR